MESCWSPSGRAATIEPRRRSPPFSGRTPARAVFKRRQLRLDLFKSVSRCERVNLLIPSADLSAKAFSDVTTSLNRKRDIKTLHTETWIVYSVQRKVFSESSLVFVFSVGQKKRKKYFIRHCKCRGFTAFKQHARNAFPSTSVGILAFKSIKIFLRNDQTSSLRHQVLRSGHIISDDPNVLGCFGS